MSHCVTSIKMGTFTLSEADPSNLSCQYLKEQVFRHIQPFEVISSGFDRASSLICGNKMPTRCNRFFLLQILLLAQHVSGAIMSIIRSPRVFYSWLLPVAFGALVSKLSGWCGADTPDTQPSAPHHTDNLKTKAPNATGSNQL